jgi:hypothetical protein
MDPDLGGERLEEKDLGIDISVPKIEVLKIRFSGLGRTGMYHECWGNEITMLSW